MSEKGTLYQDDQCPIRLDIRNLHVLRGKNPEKHIFTFEIFVLVLTALCLLDLKIFCTFFERCLSFRALRIMGELYQSPLFSYGGFE